MTIDPAVRSARRRHMLIGVAILLALTALIWVGLSRRGHEADGGADATKPPRPAAKAEGDNAIVLDAAEAARAGIETVVLRTVGDAGAVNEQSGVGIRQVPGELVADPTRLTTIRAAVPGRLVSTSWPTLGQAIAAGRIIGQVSDAKPLLTPRAGTVTRLGAQPGELVQAGQELLQLTDYSGSLARLVWRAELGVAPPSVTVAPASGTTTGVTARLVGLGADVDSVTRSPVYLYRFLGGWVGARPGLPIVATFRSRVRGASAPVSSGAQGLFVPNAAVIQWNALAWVYVERAPRRYVRVRVLTDQPTTGGYVVPVGALKAGDHAVTRGAQQLLSEEFSAQTTGTDEDRK